MNAFKSVKSVNTILNLDRWGWNINSPVLTLSHGEPTWHSCTGLNSIVPNSRKKGSFLKMTQA